MSPKIKIFLSYAREDVDEAYKLYRQLKAEGFEPWMDKENLLPGQDWDLEIKKSLRESDFVIVFLSKISVSRRGYIQKEFKLVFDILNEIPSGRIFLFPLKLDDCEVPENIKHIQWIDYFEDSAFAKIVTAINSIISKQSLEKGYSPFRQIPVTVGEEREAKFASELGEFASVEPVETVPRRKKRVQNLRVINDYFTYHPLATIALATSPFFWVMILSVFGDNFGLIEPSGQYTSFSKTVLVVLLSISSLFIIFWAVSGKYDDIAKRSGQFVLFSMLDSVKSIDLQRYKYALRIFQKADNIRGSISPLEITNPNKVLEVLIGEILYCLSSLFDISRSAISINIAYRTQDSDWQWFIPNSLNVDFSRRVFFDPQSTFRNLINKKLDSLFFPAKTIGKASGQYLENERDHQNKGIGSILCYNVSVGTSQTKYLEAVLCISTYGIQMCSENDGASKDKITYLLIPTFANRIRTELAMKYISEMFINTNP